MAAVSGMFSGVMNVEMARQTSEGHGSLQNTDDQLSRTTDSYVRRIAVKFSEQMGETSSSTGLLLAQRSHNVPISFSLHVGSSSENVQSRSRSVTVSTESHAPKCSGNVIDSAAGSKVRTSERPVVFIRSSTRSSDPMIIPPKLSDVKNQPSHGFGSESGRKFSDPCITLPRSFDAKNSPLLGTASVSSSRSDSDPLITRPASSDAKNRASPAVKLVDGLKSPSATDLQQCCVEPPDTRCDSAAPVIRSTATLKLSGSCDECAETGSSDACG